MKYVIFAAILASHNVGVHAYSQQLPSLLGFLRSTSKRIITDHPDGLPAKIAEGDAHTVHVQHHPLHEAGEEEHGLHEEGGGEHGHHGEEPHGAHGEHGGHEPQDLSAEELVVMAEDEALEKESFSLALILMGGVGSLMFIFYLVNSPYIGVKISTWRVLSMTVSIFVAVLLYGTLKMLILHIFEPGFHATIGITLVLFVLFFIGTHALLFHLKGGDETQLQAYSTVAGHICGFAAMYGFADCQEVEMFEALEAKGFVLLIVSSASIISILTYAMDKVMEKVAADDGVVDAEEERWIETCDETVDDVFCLAISFLCVLFIRYLITGKVQAYEPGKLGDVSQAHANILLLVVIGFVCLVAAGTVTMIKCPHLCATDFDKRITLNLQHLNSMILAWSILFWAEWQLYVWGWESTVIGGCLVIAVLLTVFSFATVFLLSYMSTFIQGGHGERRTMKSLELALGVLVGFSWERAFDVGFEEIEHTLHHRIHLGIPPWATVTLLSLVLLIIVAPAWRFYILPKAAHLEEKADKA